MKPNNARLNSNLSWAIQGLSFCSCVGLFKEAELNQKETFFQVLKPRKKELSSGSMSAGVSGGWGVSEQGGGLRKGPWTAEEDRSLHDYVNFHGEGRWSTVARSTGLNRSGKSCRLRWVNYLKPGLKKGQLTPQEQSIIIELHSLWGNKWSMIARCLPGRTDNEIKNYWRTHFKNKEKISGSEKKMRTRAPRREKLLQQQLQQQQEQDQQQQELVDNYKKFQIGHQVEADGGDYRVRFGKDINVQEIMFMCSNNFEDDQCLPVMFDHQDGGSSMPDDDSLGGGDEGIWGELWNLDDVNVHQAHFNNTSGSSNNEQVTMQNQVPSSSCSF